MKAYVLRAQGLGIVTDKVFLGYPSKADFDAVMQKELELHGFAVGGEGQDVELRERWVRAQEIDVVTAAECQAASTEHGDGPGEPNEFIWGQLSQTAFEEMTKAARESAGEAQQITMSGQATVTNPGE